MVIYCAQSFDEFEMDGSRHWLSDVGEQSPRFGIERSHAVAQAARRWRAEYGQRAFLFFPPGLDAAGGFLLAKIFLEDLG